MVVLWWGKLRGISLLIRNEEMINKTWEKGFSKRKSFRPVAGVLRRQILQISVKIFVQLSFRFWGIVLFDGAGLPWKKELLLEFLKSLIGVLVFLLLNAKYSFMRLFNRKEKKNWIIDPLF